MPDKHIYQYVTIRLFTSIRFDTTVHINKPRYDCSHLNTCGGTVARWYKSTDKHDGAIKYAYPHKFCWKTRSCQQMRTCTYLLLNLVKHLLRCSLLFFSVVVNPVTILRSPVITHLCVCMHVSMWVCVRSNEYTYTQIVCGYEHTHNAVLSSYTTCNQTDRQTTDKVTDRHADICCQPFRTSGS